MKTFPKLSTGSRWSRSVGSSYQSQVTRRVASRDRRFECMYDRFNKEFAVVQWQRKPVDAGGGIVGLQDHPHPYLTFGRDGEGRTSRPSLEQITLNLGRAMHITFSKRGSHGTARDDFSQGSGASDTRRAREGMSTVLDGVHDLAAASVQGKNRRTFGPGTVSR